MGSLVDKLRRIEAMSDAEQADHALQEAEWKAQNRAAMDSYNEWVRKIGLPLAKYRRF